MQSLRSQTVRLISYFLCDEAIVPELSVKLVLHAVVYEKNWLRQAQVSTPTSGDVCSGFRLPNPSDLKIGKALLKAQKHDPLSLRIWCSLRRTSGATLAMAQTLRTTCFKRIKWRSKFRVTTFLMKFHLEIHGVAPQTMTSFLSMLVRDPPRLAGRPRIDCMQAKNKASNSYWMYALPTGQREVIILQFRDHDATCLRKSSLPTYTQSRSLLSHLKACVKNWSSAISAAFISSFPYWIRLRF